MRPCIPVAEPGRVAGNILHAIEHGSLSDLESELGRAVSLDDCAEERAELLAAIARYFRDLLNQGSVRESAGCEAHLGLLRHLACG